MKKIVFIIGIIVVLFGAYVYSIWDKNLRGAGPALFHKTPPADIAGIIDTHATLPPGQNDTEFPLSLPDGFKIEVFAKNLGQPRVMVFDSEGNMWVSRTREGIVTKLVVSQGRVVEQQNIFRDLDSPHGLAFDPDNPNILYIAEQHRIAKARLYSNAPLEKIMDLPSSVGHRNHFTRTIAFGPDGRLYVSIGSSCNVCREDDTRRSKIYSLNKDGSDLKEYARGLRNVVFFDWSLIDGRMWATEMGRDQLGDDLPPDEINIIEEGKNYGYPICYGKNIHDTNFDKNTYIRNPCMEPFEIPSHIDLPAHVAPLGLGFIPEEGWPENMWYDLLVAEHGSWNSSDPVGYKIVRLKLDAQGNYEGTEDFISGWLTAKNEALGRPVDIMTQPGGVMYISDDRAGVIYKVTVQTGESVM